MNGVGCANCCYDKKCAAALEGCACRYSSDCLDGAGAQAGCCSRTLAQWTGALATAAAGGRPVRVPPFPVPRWLAFINRGRFAHDLSMAPRPSLAACLSPLPPPAHNNPTPAYAAGQGPSDGACSKQLTGGPAPDAFCDCGEDLSAINLACPASSKPAPASSCCAVAGLSNRKCGDSCPCDSSNGIGCPATECCSYTPEAGAACRLDGLGVGQQTLPARCGIQTQGPSRRPGTIACITPPPPCERP
jgi:hypothetical protein